MSIKSIKGVQFLNTPNGEASVRGVLSYMCEDAYAIAKALGWWDTENEFGTKIALMHSELSEALEADREGNPPSEKVPTISCVEEELADVVIRVLDYCGRHNLDLGYAVIEKMKFNANRPYKHGGKAY